MKHKELLRRFKKYAPKEWDVWINENGLSFFGMNITGEMLDWQGDLSRGDADGDHPHMIVFLWDYLDNTYKPRLCFRTGGPPPAKFSFNGGVDWGDTRIEALVRACVWAWRKDDH